MLGLLALSVALAEVPALRGQGLTLDLGQEALSVAAPLSETWRLGLAAHPAGWSPELQLGRDLPLGEPAGRWKGEALLAGGLLLPWMDPALTLSATAGLRARREGDRVGLEGRALVPLAFEVAPQRVLRAPLHLEAALRGRVGPLWLSGRASLGASLVTGGSTTVDAALGVGLEWVGQGPGARQEDEPEGLTPPPSTPAPPAPTAPDPLLTYTL